MEPQAQDSTSSLYSAHSQWQYLTLDEQNHTPSLSYLNTLKTQWAADKLCIPDDWIAEPSVERSVSHGAFSGALNSPVVKTLCRVRDMIVPLHFHEQQSRSIDIIGPEPNFLAATSPWPDQYYAMGLSVKETICMDNLTIFHRIRDLFYYPYQYCIETDGEDEVGKVALQIAAFFQEFPGFFLKIRASNGFSELPEDSEQANFALIIRQHGSKAEAQWTKRSPDMYDPPGWQQRKEISNAMRISDTHPAVILGIVDPPHLEGSSSSSSETAPQRLARLIEPSLKAMLRTWRIWRHQKGHSSEVPYWLIAFGIIVSADGVRVLAHYPNSYDETALNPDIPHFSSCLLDNIPFDTDVLWDDYAVKWNGPMEDDKWIRNRLRLFIALLTLVKNSVRLAAIWDEIDWPRDLLDAEDELEKRHAQWDKPTPSPSYNSHSDDDEIELQDMAYEMFMAKHWVEADEEEEEEDTTEWSDEKALRINAWRQKVAAMSGIDFDSSAQIAKVDDVK